MNTFWKNSISRANKYYEAWETMWSCDILEKYYKGKQTVTPIRGAKPYQVNLVYSTIKTKSANILLSYPQYKLTPRPGNADWNQEFAMKSAQLKEDVLNTVIANEREAFANTCERIFLDSMWRFGVCEVGYAADFIRNPLAQAPLRKDQVTKVGEDQEVIDIEETGIAEMPEELPENEKIYTKRIPAKRFRVGTRDAEELDHCDWFGYYEYFDISDLKNIKNLKSDYLKESVVLSPDEYSVVASLSSDGQEKPLQNTLKVWHIWDMRAKKRFMFLDASSEVIWEVDFKRNPIKTVRWDLDNDGWYPIPPVYQWLSPQNEYNESREMMRAYRKRFLRKYQSVGAKLDQEEMDKLTSNEDGSIINVEMADQIRPISNPELSATVKESLVISRDDFNEVAGQGSADRGRSDRTTATETQRIAVKSDIRDSAEDAKMMGLYKAVGREALLCMAERFTEGVWAQLSQDPGEAFLGEVNPDKTYQYVAGEEMDDGYDFKIDCEIISSSPEKNAEEEKKFLKFLSYVNQFPQVALSPLLVRECAYRAGYRNEKIIQEMQKTAQLTLLGAANQASGNQMGPGGNQAAQAQVAQQLPPTGEEIQNQLSTQLQ